MDGMLHIIPYFCNMEEYTNELINETSPYLLQHAHNPVNWVAWSATIFERAAKENKLVLVSIGYSACHWCHVMEHECFEDEEVAALMNKLFINVKVDREERPDVDQVYMTAVQLMTQRGGWPLNCFTLPDGRPIYGGTYYPKEQWMHILKSLHHTYENEREKVNEYAANLHEGIISSELITSYTADPMFSGEKLHEMMLRWSKSFDREHGGDSKAPKFPLPSNYEFLIDYALNSGDQKVMTHVENSLDCIAMGGIYDQIGGGFSRYSVDLLWKVPHFEKMLYDNGQLVSLFTKAYKVFRKPLYKRIVHQTIEWLEREMTDDSGAFYSALDADSEGVEGKFYVWTVEELERVLQDDFLWVKELYEVNQKGHWEDGNYILLRRQSDDEFCQHMNWDAERLEFELSRINSLLFSERTSRIRPGLDDKCLTSWNAMMLKGLCDAYIVFREDSHLRLLIRNSKWLESVQCRADGGLWRNYKQGTSNIEGFLEDYAHVIDAFIARYGVDFDEKWLNKAKQLLDYAIANFGDDASKMFFFTDRNSKLIARKMEVNDNVIPASNSVMARNLYYLGRFFKEDAYIRRARAMLGNVYDGMEMYGSGYSNWALLLNHEVFSLYEIVVMSDAAQWDTLQTARMPHVLIARQTKDTSLPIFSDKKDAKSDLFFVCVDGACLQPTTDTIEAINQVIQ